MTPLPDDLPKDLDQAFRDQVKTMFDIAVSSAATDAESAIDRFMRGIELAMRVKAAIIDRLKTRSVQKNA